MDDWGERDPRWAGIRTAWVDVQGTAVRTLRVDPTPEGRGGTPQLLVHGLGGSATNWLEVMAGLARYGAVLAMDLPGFGHTEPPVPGAARVRANARFVPALCRALGWDRVVLHGNSMGGLITTLVAGDHPPLVERLVLVNPGLPAPRTQMHRLPPSALLRFAPFLSRRLGRAAMHHLHDRLDAEQLYEQTIDVIYADRENLRPALREVAIENVAHAHHHDWRIDGFVDAATSLVGLVTGARTVLRAVDAITAPTLVLWGDADQLVGRPVIDGLVVRRPEWDLHVFPGCGHVPMLEFPDDYLDVVGRWLVNGQVGRAELSA